MRASERILVNPLAKEMGGGWTPMLNARLHIRRSVERLDQEAEAGEAQAG